MFHRMMNYGEMDVRPTACLTKDIIKRFMPKFKRHDDLIIIQKAAWEEFKKSLPIPVAKEENSPFSIDEDELASLVCQTIQKPACRRLAVERGIKNDDYRTPDVELILGDTGIVNHKENHITYRFDITKCMFSFGNINEKMRMAELNCSDEIVVDLFAGIGYFSLPLLVHAKAKHLYACEWNPDSIDALRKNLLINKIDSSRFTVIEGDNRSNRPTDVAQRVILGILPSCLDYMKTAFECIDKSTGAILHCHDLVETKPFLGENKQTTTTTSASSLNNSLELSSDKNLSTNQMNLINQSLSSSSSSQSTIEKLMASSTDDKTLSSESDKTTSSSPVFLEKPSESICTTNNSSVSTISTATNNDQATSITNETTTSGSSLYFEADSINDSSPQINDQELGTCEARAQALIAKIKEDVEAHDLTASLMLIRPVKSYAPCLNHVVFDIKIEPKSQLNHNKTLKFPIIQPLYR